MKNILKHMSRLRKDEAGQVLVYVTIIVALAAIIITPILHFTYAGHHSARTRIERMSELYAADAGIEDAMYQIKNADPLNPDDPIAALNYWDNTSFDVGVPQGWNDRDMNVSVEKVWIPKELTGDLYLASPTTGYYADKLSTGGLFTNVEMAAAEDNFDSGSWAGGTGWDTSWTHTGSASISNLAPYKGTYHLNFTDGNGRVERQTSLNGFYEPQLRFYANAYSFESGDTAECQVSLDGSNWHTAYTWADGSDIGTYELVSINLNDIDPGYGNATNFWVAFESNAVSRTIAVDDFECGNWFCCPEGWNGDWAHSTSHSAVDSSGGPYGSYHMRLTRTGWAEREVTLTADESMQLSFNYKMNSNFDSTDRAYLMIYVNDSLYDTRTLSRRTSYGQYTYTLPPGNIKIRFEASTDRTDEYLYVDNISISDAQGDHFYVDEVWVGNRIDIYTLEVAYTDFEIGNAYLDRLAVWLPPGTEYIRVVESFGLPLVEPTYIEPAFAGGTVVQWNFNRSVNLATPVGAEGLPIIRSMSFTFSGGDENQGMFVWMRACSNQTGDCGNEYLSWDKGYALYRTTSQASHEIWGTNTKIEAYVGQGELNKRGLATYGNYVATGAPLLIDYAGSASVKEKRIDPKDPDTWVWKDGFYYDARSDITTLPADAEIIAAWLYWSAFVRNSEWTAPDETVDFMFPKYYTDSFHVSASPYNLAHYPVVDLPQQPQLHLYPLRHCDEELGTAYIGDGNNTFFTDSKPVLTSPAPAVWAGVVQLTEGDDYVINYSTGNVTVINDEVGGMISIDYSVSGSQTLTEGVDYTLEKSTGLITVRKSCLAGTVTINYWAETWETVQHNAVNRYGMALDPAQTVVPPSNPVGHTYACFYDATQLLRSAGINGVHPGTGEYAVGDIASTQGVDGTEYATRCFSGWSLIILYRSDSETAHQFYLYDPIHTPDECPFMMLPSTDPGVPDPHEEIFSLKDFYPPAGSVQGRVTYFVGEGDVVYDGDYIQFKGVSQPSYTTLSGPNNPANNTMNCVSTTGEKGIDIDTYDILSQVGSDTEANVKLVTDGDRWYLIYMILSFKTSVVPKADYAFNVAAITYSYELGTLGQ
jgi:hypothetical protein